MRWVLKHERNGNKPWAVQTAAMEARIDSGREKYGWWIECGMGKTSLALNEFIQLPVNLCIVICPNSFKQDWGLAPAEWGIPEVLPFVWGRNNHSMIKAFTMVKNRKRLLAINYESARRNYNSYRFLEKLIEREPTMLIVDESSYIKNPDSETSNSVLELCKRAKYVRLLNGTPQTQNVMDWYPQLRCLGELDGVKSVIFRNRFAEMGGFMGRQVVGVKNQDMLEPIIQRCSFRALKSDWRQDLPPQLDVPIHLEMTAKQHEHYDEMMEEFYTIVDDLEIPAKMIITQMDKLRQISSCIVMHKGESRTIEDLPYNPKIKATKDLIASGSTKMIVVYTYKLSGDILHEALNKAGYSPAVLKGGMNPDILTDEKRRFNEDPTCRAYIVQQSAGCMGHTMIGGEGNDRCNRMIFYEDAFSLRDYLQMRDRNHRGEQDLPCTYYHLVTSPMDQTIINALVEKKAASDAIDDVIKTVKKLRGIKIGFKK